MTVGEMLLEGPLQAEGGTETTPWQTSSEEELHLFYWLPRHRHTTLLDRHQHDLINKHPFSGPGGRTLHRESGSLRQSMCRTSIWIGKVVGTL